MKRLLLVNAHGADTSLGGAERYVADLAHGLRARGYDVSVLSAFPVGDPEAASVVLHGRDWRESPVRRLQNHAGDVLARPSRRLAEAIASQRPDLVHSNNLPGLSTAVWEVCRRLGVPVVHTLHDYQLLCPRVTLLQPDGTPCRPHPLLCGLRRRRLGRWSGAVGQVIAVSRSIAETHSSFFPSASFHVIKHAFSSPFDRPLSPPSRELATIGFIGSLGVTKGVNVLLDAAASIAAAGCTLHVAGDGLLRERVEAAARRSEVRYEGRVGGAAKRSFFERCDLGIVPSLWKEPGGPPYTVLEWLAAGRPVLISPRGGLREAIGAHPGVIAVEPTVAAIVERVRALREPAAWQRAVEAVEPVASDDDGERWLSDHERVYQAAWAPRGARKPLSASSAT